MKRHLILDASALLLYLVIANPLITGIALHEWLGLGVLVVFLVHTAVHYDWVIDVMKRRNKGVSLSRQGNLILDVLLLLTFLVVTVSGLCISGEVLPSFGVYMKGYYFWDPLHIVSAKVLLALIVVHVVVHWKWVASFFRKDANVEQEDHCGKNESHILTAIADDEKGVSNE